jgi:FMN phosphatase YigB (HAD superfamily)
MENRIKNLVLDFGGVLLDIDIKHCIEEFKKIGLSDVERYLTANSQEDIFHKFEKGLITAPDFRMAIREKIGKILTDKQIDDVWNSMLIGVSSHKLDFLLELRENYVVYLLSNTNEIHWKWACKNAFAYRGFRAEDYFEKTFLSFEMKKAKPDPEIFKTVLTEANILPEETFFIDDSSVNCAAAETLGITSFCSKTGDDWIKLF